MSVPKKYVQGTPVFRDEVLVLAELGNATVRRPMRILLVVERHVHVRVVLDFVELVNRALRADNLLNKAPTCAMSRAVR